MKLFEAMKNRCSARSFLDRPVARKDLEELFNYAGMAPSAINMQPWEYVIAYGEEKDRLVKKLLRTRKERQVACGPGTAEVLPEKYIDRSRDAAALMHPAVAELGIPFNDFIEEGSCSFYGAPVTVIVTIDRRFPPVRYLDLGLGIAYLLLAAEAKGIATCPIGLVTAYSDEICETLDIPEEREVALGIAVGYADPDAPLNRLRTERAARDEILTWYE